MLANFACNPKASKGRLYPEPSHLNLLSPFAADRMRIIESSAFRRLAHKTQVFVNYKGDHYRNRLTHSLEAAQISRIVSDALNICSDLSESITLAHDLGHAPFGHSGEHALSELMQEYQLNFDHNSHTIKLLTELEKQHSQFNGLNLSWEILEGIAKHNGPLTNLAADNAVLLYSQKHDLDLNRFSSLEAQVSALSDDIAYNNHDIEDGVEAGLIDIEKLREVKLLGSFITLIEQKNPLLEARKIAYKAVQMMKNTMILDLIDNTKANLKKHQITSCEDIRALNKQLTTFSNEVEDYHQSIKKFLRHNVYKEYSVDRATSRGKRIIKELFAIYMNNPECLPGRWKTNIASLNKKEMAKLICDFIACMSDRYAIAEYQSFFDFSS